MSFKAAEAEPGQIVAIIASPNARAGQAPEVSVVISTYNRCGFLRGLLACLQAQTLPADRFEVIIVDNGSVDRTWDLLSRYAALTPLRMRALRLAENLGAGSGRNVALSKCEGPVVAFTDDDCLPTPGWLANLIEPLRQNGHEAPALIVQGRTVPLTAWGQAVSETSGKAASEAWGQAVSETSGKAASAAWEKASMPCPTEPSARTLWPEDAKGPGSGVGPWARSVWVLGPTWLFETCNIAYRHADLEKVGCFPSGAQSIKGALGRAFGEDAILGWRVHESGAELVFAPEALVHHRLLPCSYWQWLLEQYGRRGFPGLVSQNPAIRRAFWNRIFLARRTAAFDLALAACGCSFTSRKARWLLGCLPWIWLALPEAAGRRGRNPGVRLIQLAIGDLVGMAGLAAGSLKHRRLVL
ncbi:MAG: glycosyltransferase [Actinobacteria bacterium]|nr:glycosyltransferase [Actinomycetota bacterium]